jgi:hypothetical protein
MLAQRATRGSAHVSGAQHGADRDDSKGFGTDRVRVPTVLTLRLGLALAGLAGALMLLVATFTSVIDITVGTTSRVLDADTAQSGWDRHGPVLVLLALAALLLLAAALRGARVAMAGLCGVGLVVIAIAWFSVGDVYAEATADPGTGYYLETLGGALILLSGGSLLVLGVGGAPSGAPATGADEGAADRARARRAARAE